LADHLSKKGLGKNESTWREGCKARVDSSKSGEWVRVSQDMGKMRRGFTLGKQLKRKKRQKFGKKWQ